ncbi:phage terminase large subunit family protein [Pseudoxanthomonas winnipegensis]|uniref:phage terminase large subunit family protein n=1 Tax=Pseudoxanthomonas winnipegensis TaxID=2480810 RepID=UPI0013EF0DC2|nr:phage terminase large subunit family protein [Pseudoxanthomonas winnipegensis]
MSTSIAPAYAAYARAAHEVGKALARAIAPRKPMRVSEWAARHRRLSQKGSAIPGEWRNERNPLLVEIMDCFSARSPVHDVVGMLCIQFGKSELEANILGYAMCENPQPIMVVLPGEVSMNKWIDQKLNPLIEETPAIQAVLTSTNSRESSNRRSFKDFHGGQLYFEHAGNPVRLKSTSAGLLLVDEFSSFASQLKSGDDPSELLDGRTSAFPSTYKRLKVGTPEIEGLCRISELYAISDKRRWHWPCPDCGHEQPFEWAGLQWTPDTRRCWYVCRECGVVIEEHQKPQLIAAGRWIPENPGARIRGYHANALYYPMGLGPRWLDLVHMWLAAQNDPAKLKTFVNDRLAEPWRDKTAAKAAPNVIKDRREPYRLRVAPLGVLAVTAGVDTQDDRLAVQIIGWGRGMVAWVLDYIELSGDPGEDDVWARLTDLLNRPIAHARGGFVQVEATAIDAGGHRTESVKHFCRQRRIRNATCIFGARPNNAPILSRPKLEDVNYKGKLDKKGVNIHHVGTVAVKQWLFQRLAADADKPVDARLFHITEDLDDFYVDGLVSERYNPRTNRYDKVRGGVRNEPLDTAVYAYAVTHHQNLRLHRASAADWDTREQRIIDLARSEWDRVDSRETCAPVEPAPRPDSDSRETADVAVALARVLSPPMHTRAALDAIVTRLERDAMAPVATADRDAWAGATGGTAEEVTALAALVGRLIDDQTPLGALLPPDVAAPARAVLRGPVTPNTPPPRRFVRGTRNSGLR